MKPKDPTPLEVAQVAYLAAVKAVEVAHKNYSRALRRKGISGFCDILTASRSNMSAEHDLSEAAIVYAALAVVALQRKAP